MGVEGSSRMKLVAAAGAGASILFVDVCKHSSMEGGTLWFDIEAATC